MEHVQEISNDAQPYLVSACKHFDTPVKAVVKTRVEDGQLVLLWDRGILGIAKARVPLSDLRAKRTINVAIKTEPGDAVKLKSARAELKRMRAELKDASRANAELGKANAKLEQMLAPVEPATEQ